MKFIIYTSSEEFHQAQGITFFLTVSQFKKFLGSSSTILIFTQEVQKFMNYGLQSETSANIDTKNYQHQLFSGICILTIFFIPIKKLIY